MQSESTSPQETPTSDAAVVDKLEALFGPSPEDTADAGSASADDDQSQAQSEDVDAAEPAATEDDPDSQDEGEDGDGTPAELPATVKVKVDGQEIEVTLDEALKGYSRTADYTRKTQAHSEKVKAFETEQAATREARTRFDQGLAQVEEALKELMPPEPNWEELRASGQYSQEAINTAYINYQRQKEQLAGIRAERQKIAEQNQREFEAARQQVVAENREKLFEALPDLKDETKAPALREEMTAFATGRGFTLDELNNTTDYRSILLLHDAMMYHKLLAKQKAAAGKVEEQIRTAKPGVGRRGAPPKRTDEERARARLADTGSVEDAADVLLARARG